MKWGSINLTLENGHFNKITFACCIFMFIVESLYEKFWHSVEGGHLPRLIIKFSFLKWSAFAASPIHWSNIFTRLRLPQNLVVFKPFFFALFLKSVNLKYNTLVRRADGTNESWTKHLMFQVHIIIFS